MSRQNMSWNVKFSHVKIVLFYVILYISYKGDISFKMVAFFYVMMRLFHVKVVSDDML